MNRIEENAASAATSIAQRNENRHRNRNLNDVPQCDNDGLLMIQDRQPLLMKLSTSLESFETNFPSRHVSDGKKIAPIHHQYGAIIDTTDPTPSSGPPKFVTNRWYYTRKTISRLFATVVVIALIGVFVVGIITTISDTLDDSDIIRSLCEWSHHPEDESCPSTSFLLRHNSHDHSLPQPPIFSTLGIQIYLHLFDQKFRSKVRDVTSKTSWDRQHLLSLVNPISDTSTKQSSSSSSLSSITGVTDKTNVKNNAPALVIAGKMTIDGQPCNIGQYNLKTNEWSLSERIQLSLYNSYSGGEVYSLLANHTSTTTTTTTTTTATTTTSTSSKDRKSVV